MNILFFGNTKYSLIGAKIIHDALGIATIVTIPDRPDKRGRMTASPLKSYGVEKNIPVIEINKFDGASTQQIIDLKPDFLIVEDYGLILPQKLLDAAKHASLNIHHSLLPKYRGPSPAPTAILNGDAITGVTVIKMSKEVDAGDILAQEKYAMKKDETTDSLLTVLNEVGATILVPVIANFEKIEGKKQNNDEATLTKMMKKEDGFIDATNPPAADKLDRMIRAYYPWPNVWTKLLINGAEKIVKLLPTTSSLRGVSETNDEAISSTILLQVEGKNPMSMKDFINGYPAAKKVIERLLSLLRL